MPLPDRLKAAARRYAPRAVRRLARALLGRNELAALPPGGLGVVEDLCYWVSDRRVDTVVPLHNYFSILFPDLETATTARVDLFDPRGRALVGKDIDLSEHALVTVRASDMVGADVAESFGALLCHIRIPAAVREFLAADAAFHFWDRFYVSYVTRDGQPCFVHGVDKTYVAGDDGTRRTFYPVGKVYSWRPEIPVDMRQYERLSVILINRTAAAAALTLTLSDPTDAARSWTAHVAPFGTHRFELDAASTEGLAHAELRLRVDGMPTRWGRPVIMKHFRNGAISAMHC
jgi:hypothetical protein